MLDDTSKRGRIVQAALRLAERDGWQSLTLAGIAGEAGVSLAALQGRFVSKTSILVAFVEAVDNATLKQVKAPDMDAPARDRIFEVVMTRLDVLKPYKGALARIRADCRCAPPGPGAARLACASMNSQRWMLEAAGIPASGPKGCARASGLLCVYGRVVQVWLKDDEPDLAKTMAVLDRELRSGERWLKRLDALCGDLKRFACRFAPRRRGRPQESKDAPGPAEQPSAG